MATPTIRSSGSPRKASSCRRSAIRARAKATIRRRCPGVRAHGVRCRQQRTFRRRRLPEQTRDRVRRRKRRLQTPLGRLWQHPDDARLSQNNPVSPQFANPVHCVRQTRDGLLYVRDRASNRIPDIPRERRVDAPDRARAQDARAGCGAGPDSQRRSRTALPARGRRQQWCTVWRAKAASASAPSAAAPAISIGCTTSPSTRSAASMPRTSIAASARRAFAACDKRALAAPAIAAAPRRPCMWCCVKSQTFVLTKPSTRVACLAADVSATDTHVTAGTSWSACGTRRPPRRARHVLQKIGAI